MAEENLYDVAITGGGLAGLCLAIQSAERGFSTILFEKEKYPFHKVCGEYISMESYPFLKSLGFDPAAFDVPYINKLTITDVKGTAYNFQLSLGGFGISRYTLDAALYKIAVQKGVEVIHTKVHDIQYRDDLFAIENTVQPCNAKVAVGSFGKRSNLDVKWQRPFTTKQAADKNYVGIKYHVQYPHAKDNITLHNFKDGYCGISAIEEDKCCVCYLTTAAQLQASGNSIARLQNEILSENRHLRNIFSSASFVYEEPLAISKISFAEKSIVKDHVLFAGDSAGLITPLCGNGMSMAMHASKICFQAIDAFLKNKISRQQMEMEYTSRWQKQFKTRLVVGRNVQRFFGHPTTTSMFLKTMKLMPPVARALIRSTHGATF